MLFASNRSKLVSPTFMYCDKTIERVRVEPLALIYPGDQDELYVKLLQGFRWGR